MRNIVSVSVSDGDRSLGYGCNDVSSGESSRAALTCTREVFERLALLVPGLEVRAKGAQAMAWIVAAIGLAFVALGLGFAIIGGGTFGLVLGGLIGGVGAVTVARSAPWRVKKTLTAAEVAATVSRLASSAQ